MEGTKDAGRCSASVGPENGQQETKKESFLEKIGSIISHSLENCFASIGKKIGGNPWKFIIASFLLAALSSIGILSFYEEKDTDKLWVPEGSWVRTNKGRAEASFPLEVVQENIIAVSDNILTPSGIAALLDIYQESLSLRTADGIQLTDVCQRADSKCLVKGILEIWSFDNATIRSLSQAQINDDIRNTAVSPVSGRPIDLVSYLGDVSHDGNGDLTAKAALLLWLTREGDLTDAWEDEFIKRAKGGHPDLIDVYVAAGRSWSDESDKAFNDDVFLLSIGYVLVGTFVLFSIGKCNLMEQKAWLTLSGFLCVGFSIATSIGLSSALGLVYGTIQSVLPFLLLGLGVDDMFVIMGAVEDLSPEDRLLEVSSQVSLALKHAGVSITVTSLTDTVAFLVGANTIIPGLMSFCIYAGIGIVSLYVFQCTFFTACLAIDIKRMKARRDGCCLMIKHDDDYTPNDCSQKKLVPFVFSNGLVPLLSKLPIKIVIMVVAAALFGVNIWGFVGLKQKFDPRWFIPTDSYLSKFYGASDTYFPTSGFSSYVYCRDIDYWGRRTDLENLDRLLKENEYIQNGTTDSWFGVLKSWLQSTNDSDIRQQLNNESYPSTRENFGHLTHVLASNVTPQFWNDLKFEPTAINISASRFPYAHISVDSSADKISAMDSVRDAVKAAGFSTNECFPYTFSYLIWETDRIIQKELYRNLGVAMACVFVVTLILIANLFTSTIVFVGVIATLVDVAGSMHFWGLTIDTVSGVVLILSIGLAVDYSAHIGHRFMTLKGTREERIKRTLETMGPPVFYGAFSTLLAFILLSSSNSYIFTTFFKVNFLVVVYGLFHGLLFVPVVLSLIGPDPYSTPPKKPKKELKSITTISNGFSNDAFTAEMPGNYKRVPRSRRSSAGTLYEKSGNRSRRQSVSSRTSQDYGDSRRTRSNSFSSNTQM